MRKPRKNYTPPEKVAILRRHLIDKVPVSDLCDEYQLQPTLFYAWQKLFFENGAAAFERKNGSADQALQKTISALLTWPATQVAALSAPGVSGARSGYCVASWLASAAAERLSNTGGGGAGSAWGCVTVNETASTTSSAAASVIR